MLYKIKPVDVNAIIPVRHRVLRIGKPISTCHFEGDNHPTAFHFAAYHNEDVIGCVSLMRKAHEKIKDSKAYQLRGMAVLEKYQGKNIGKNLLEHAEKHLSAIHVNTIWCNVRIKAVPFYKKNQYHQIGNEFNIPDVGPHVLMFKSIA